MFSSLHLLHWIQMEVKSINRSFIKISVIFSDKYRLCRRIDIIKEDKKDLKVYIELFSFGGIREIHLEIFSDNTYEMFFSVSTFIASDFQ